MSLSVASTIALSALRASQVGISVTSSNIANADVDGYTVKTANQVSTVAATTGSGTAVTSITGGVDKYVFASLISANADLGAASVTASYTDQLQALMGSTTGSDDGGTSVATLVTDLQTAISSLASSPEDDTVQSEVIAAADSLASSLRETSASIQSLRSDADQQIADDVDVINDALQTIDDLNEAILAAEAKGASTADLEDQRNTAIETISSLIGIKTTTASNGSIYISTTGGTALLTSTVHELSFSASATVNASSVLSGISVDGEDITEELTSGEIGGLLTLRDTTLVEAQDELDALATALIETLNAVTADGSAVPAPESLTGATQVSSTDTLSASGSVRIAQVDEDGALVAYTDLDLSSYATIGDLVSALDAIDGIDASLDSDGKLTITSTTDAGVAIGALDGDMTGDGTSFSSYFGLNALLTGSSAASVSLSSAIANDASALAIGTLSNSTTVGATVLTSGSSTVADGLLAAMTETQSFEAVGGIGSTTVTLGDYAARIVSDFASRASNAEEDETSAETLATSLSDTIASRSGVNIDEETSKLSDYQALYSAAAQIIQAANEMFEALLSAAKSA
ncbi:flagellar hook-associated protein FlgK [Pleomorphomonas diazotrophica]|uniref:Flagellar hook-associated protein 1 n=1 Tax=Pleomorphomonas diazotrophica TaxID=1166257 RepID=A0A1I4QNF5_9HYPH|nr:flagellar hook-associated protein FlgK [Pleomorphomonas diazotrophica]PKR90532.1 flagellar hook-associated protein FlgK [Pleomorphomonas diazotrophica]SFM41648.1 flagellar hook-associated protein 1 FlgK [Pleomorphomonas diazotrophica]